MMINRSENDSDLACCQVRHGVRRALSAIATGLALCLAGAGYAADPPKAASPSNISPGTPPGTSLAAPADVPSPLAAPVPLSSTPAETLAAMADSLSKNGDAVVATIEGQPITQADAADVIRAMPSSLASLGFQPLYRRALDQLILQRLTALSAEKAGLDKDPSVRRRQRAATERALADAWLVHEADATVTDQAVRARYDRDVAGRPGREEVRARVILVPTEAEARALIVKIQAGGDFADLARQFSKDASAVAGGDLDYVPLDALGPEVGSVMFALSPGGVTFFPVRAPAGYFIIRVEGRRQRGTPTYDEARAALTRELRREAATAVVRAFSTDVKLNEPAAAPAGR